MKRAFFIFAAMIAVAGSAYAASTLKQPEAAEKQFARSWPGLVSRATNNVAAQCGGRSAPIHILLPETLYRGMVGDVAVSTEGMVAAVDLSKSMVLVFADVRGRNPSFQIPVGVGFDSDSLKFSEDSRFLSWATPYASYVYDLPARKFALTIDNFGEHDSQWIGNDLLLIGNDDDNMNIVTTSLFRWKDGRFQKTVLDTMIFGKGHMPAGSTVASMPAKDEFVSSDQFGKSFLGRGRVYSDINAAINDRVEIFSHKKSSYKDSVYRIGEFLLQPSDNGNIFQKPETPWSLVLRDGATAKTLKAVPLPMPVCVPSDMAISDDQSEIAVLMGFSVLVLNPGDLSIKAVYGLDASAVASPKSIALVPDGEFVIWAQTPDHEQQAILVYKPKT
jgi:hypothetical protein